MAITGLALVCRLTLRSFDPAEVLLPSEEEDLVAL